MDITIEEMRSKPVRVWRTLINVVPLRMSHSLKVPYTSRISFRVLNLVFSRGRGGGWRGANSKQGAYLKLGAKNTDPLRPGGLPYNRDGDARGTIRIKPLNEINLCLSQDFFDKGDHISSNTVWQCFFCLYQGISLRTEDEIGWNHSLLP